MVIFINDKPVTIIGQKKFKNLHGSDYDTLIDARLDKFNERVFIGHIVILNVDNSSLERLFKGLFEDKFKDFQSITLVVEDRDLAEEKVKSLYKIVKAAGGIVFNADGKILMIHRLGKWDLPKGKRDFGEKSKLTAVREVEEECNISVRLGEKVCTTWHTYTQGGRNILKRTKWYKMDCTDDSKMKPQLDEDIDDLKWMDEKEVRKSLLNSYSSIRYVFDCLNNPSSTD
ncbi:MAG: NUDIX hydrolase [Spirosomaceae bacterium]|jgi:8-oxo-dGTP pyrophosphatase MutT (NUDIX family)|nr:NUDIX hydrolase [Spirosomataceae bacterium]